MAEAWTEAEDAELLRVVTGYGAAPPAWWIEKHMPGRTRAAVEQRVSRVIKARIVEPEDLDRRPDGSGLDDGPRFPKKVREMCLHEPSPSPIDHPLEQGCCVVCGASFPIRLRRVGEPQRAYCSLLCQTKDDLRRTS
jgi:hypothetical protein